MNSQRAPLSLRSKAILSIIFLAITAGLIHTATSLAGLSAKRRLQPFVFAGESFEAIKPLFKGERAVGYISDRNIDDKNIGSQFAQAQLAMAPIILDFNNPKHRFLIIDCQNERYAAAVVQKTNARPIKRSSSGIIVAERMVP